MKNTARALSLKIDAPSPEDLVMLLRQAIYEVEKLLPPPPDAPEHVRTARLNRSLLAGFESTSRDESSVVTGHAKGSLGTYEFEFHLNSRAYTALERTLLDEGFTRTTPQPSFMSDDRFIYTHPTRASQCIDGEPLAIRDAPHDKTGDAR